MMLAIIVIDIGGSIYSSGFRQEVEFLVQQIRSLCHDRKGIRHEMEQLDQRCRTEAVELRAQLSAAQDPFGPIRDDKWGSNDDEGTAPHKRAQVAPRIAAELTGSAKKFITGQPADWLSFAGGVERLIEKLRQGLGRPKISEVTEHLSKFFKYSRRKPGESINDYVARRSEVYLRAQQAMARLGKTTRKPRTETTWPSSERGSYTGAWSRRSSVDSGVDGGDEQPPEEEESTAAPMSNWTWTPDNWWSSSSWGGWTGSSWDQWSYGYQGQSWKSYVSTPEALPELLPDFIQGWLLLQDAGLDSNERGLVMTTTGEDYSVDAIAHAMRTLFTDGDMKKRDTNKRQHGYWGSIEDATLDEEAEDPMDDAEAQETLDDDSFAMWSEAQSDIQGAMAAINTARRTLRDARAKQHAVKMSRQYYKVGSRPGSSQASGSQRPRDDSQIVCLRCQKKGHRAANCPLPPPSANMAHEETASFICYAEGMISEEPEVIQEDFPETRTRPPQQTASAETKAFIGYLEDAAPEAESAMVAGISTSEAVAQGKAILDCGATRSIGSVYALERLMEMNIKARGSSGVVSVDSTNRPVFSFGNSSMNQCAATVKMGISAGSRSGAVQIHALDHGTGPILLSVESLGMLGALIDFSAKMVVLRAIDDTKVLPLEQTATGHLVVPLSEDLLAKAQRAVQKVPGLDWFLQSPADE
ncbi:hypothetical protein AK812_SmicGene18559 [Symbiodinium microadriaticum]|uniref:CCHC-type domain-containing protein n=1 Tax=Symbiodinium microadriaticum TaxID=2951 RepID=A0A1Q9DUT7_SYMMI|nr:hypothetical protein AK812_SmicGene18559 [Symbiodinium microadriaticum]